MKNKKKPPDRQSGKYKIDQPERDFFFSSSFVFGSAELFGRFGWVDLATINRKIWLLLLGRFCEGWSGATLP